MSLRDYRDYAQSKYGKKSVNETTLKMMEKAVGSSGSKGAYDRANANIKIAQALREGKK
jgi:hypothetical protein